MSSRIKQEFKIMWANVWFRSLCELLAIAVGMVVFIILLQATPSGRQVIEVTKKMLPAIN